MQDERVGRGGRESKARDLWYKREPVRALAGFARLSLEERGAYCTLIELTMRDGKPPEDDDVNLAHEMRCHIRVWRRVRASLIAKGRIGSVDGRLVDERALETLEAREAERVAFVENGRVGGRKSAAKRVDSARSGGDRAELSARSPPNLRAVSNKNSGLAEAPLKHLEEKRIEEKEDSAAAAAAAARERGRDADSPQGIREISDRVLAACGPGMVDPARSHIPLLKLAGRLPAWLARFDLELDILPVLAAKTARRRNDPIRDPTIFEADIAAHHAARTQPLAAPPETPDGNNRADNPWPARGRGSRSLVQEGIDFLAGRSAAADQRNGTDDAGTYRPGAGDVPAIGE